MKLSLHKRLGWIHVRGGKLLKVAKEHAVASSGRSEAEGPTPQDGVWAFAQKGDLVVEIVVVKTGKVLGHSYLSGPAIQCNRYTPAQSDWFEPAEGKLLELPERPERLASATGEELEEGWAVFTLAIIKALTEAKYQGDLAVFEVVVSNQDETREALEYFSRASDYEKNDDDGGGRAHLIGVFHDKKSVTGLIHQQPEHHSSEHHMTGFQAALVLNTLKGESWS